MAADCEVLGYILLVTHAGVPTEWPVRTDTLSDQSDLDILKNAFERAKNMCQFELVEGGTMKLYDADRNLIEDV